VSKSVAKQLQVLAGTDPEIQPQQPRLLVAMAGGTTATSPLLLWEKSQGHNQSAKAKH